MKVTIEVDCTPDEARQFFGLPDVKPLQAAAMARLEKQLNEAASALAPEALLRTWLSFLPQSPEQFRETVGGLFRAPFGSAGSNATHAQEPAGRDLPPAGST